MSVEYIKKIKIEEENDVQALKKHIKEIAKGIELTSSVMDSCLKRFGVVQISPLGEKFDPNQHEAIFTMAESEYQNNQVGAIMQAGWKIGDRTLRAAKVGIVKKPTTVE